MHGPEALLNIPRITVHPGYDSDNLCMVVDPEKGEQRSRDVRVRL